MRPLQGQCQLVDRLHADPPPDRRFARRLGFLQGALARVVFGADAGLQAARPTIVGAQLELVLREAVGLVAARQADEHVGGHRGIGSGRRLVVALVAGVARAQAQAVDGRGGEPQAGVECVSAPLQRLRGQGWHDQAGVGGQGEVGRILRHAAERDLGAGPHGRADRVTGRRDDLVELVAGRQCELAGGVADGRGWKRVGPGQRFRAAAEQRCVVRQRGLPHTAVVRRRDLELIGHLVHRGDEVGGVREEGARGALGAVAHVVEQADAIGPVLASDQGSTQVGSCPLETEIDALQRRGQRHRPRACRGKSARQRQHAAAVAEERRPRAVRNPMRKFGVTESQGVQPFLPDFSRQRARVEAEVRRRHRAEQATFATVARCATRNEEAALLVQPGVVTEFGRIVRDDTGTHVHGAADAGLFERTRFAFPLRRVHGGHCAAGGGRQRAERAEQEQGAGGSHGRVRPESVVPRCASSARTHVHRISFAPAGWLEPCTCE